MLSVVGQKHLLILKIVKLGLSNSTQRDLQSYALSYLSVLYPVTYVMCWVLTIQTIITIVPNRFRCASLQ